MAARNALRNLLHQIRGQVGRDLLRVEGKDRLGIAEGVLSCDVYDFEAALDRGRHREALELYRGALLEGFRAPDEARDYEAWRESEARRLERQAPDAAWTLAGESEAEEALYWAERATRMAPLADHALRRFLALCGRLREPARAVRV